MASARAAAKVRVIAITALQQTLRRKVLYIVVVLVAFIGLVMASNSGLLRMVGDSGQADVAQTVRADLVLDSFELWATAAGFLAVFLGAVGVSSEVTARTIVSVLSRPIDRTTYLIGRWLGIALFLWGFQLAGHLFGLAMARGFHVEPVSTIWLGMAATLVNTFMLSGVSLGFSIIMPPVVAGVVAFLLPFVPGMVAGATHDPRWFARIPAFAAYYLSPAVMPVDLIEDSFAKAALHPDYHLYARVLAENAVYATAIFALGCLLFARRELRLR